MENANDTSKQGKLGWKIENAQYELEVMFLGCWEISPPGTFLMHSNSIPAINKGGLENVANRNNHICSIPFFFFFVKKMVEFISSILYLQFFIFRFHEGPKVDQNESWSMFNDLGGLPCTIMLVPSQANNFWPQIIVSCWEQLHDWRIRVVNPLRFLMFL